MNPEFERSYENNVKPRMENVDQQNDEELHRLCDSSHLNAGSADDFISMSRDLIERFTERLQLLFKLLDETAELIVDNGELILAKNI